MATLPPVPESSEPPRRGRRKEARPGELMDAALDLFVEKGFAATRVKAYFAAMKSDLNNLASQQEIYYADASAYSTSTTDLSFTSSAGVTVALAATSSGWSASAVHAALGTTEGCVIYVGTAASPATPVTSSAPGEVACTR